MIVDDLILGDVVRIGTILPITRAGKIQLIVELTKTEDEDGNPIEPILTEEDIKKILEIKDE